MNNRSGFLKPLVESPGIHYSARSELLDPGIDEQWTYWSPGPPRRTFGRLMHLSAAGHFFSHSNAYVAHNYADALGRAKSQPLQLNTQPLLRSFLTYKAERAETAKRFSNIAAYLVQTPKSRGES